MPVIRTYIFASGTRMGPHVAPDFESGFRDYMLSHSVQPDYHADPTYNMRKKR